MRASKSRLTSLTGWSQTVAAGSMNGGVRIWELDHLRYMAESQGLLGLQPLQPLQPHTVTRTSVAAAAGAHSSSPQLTLPPTPEACVTAVVVADAQMPVGGLKAGAHHGEAGWLTEFIQVSLAICVYSVYTPPPHAHTHTSTHVRARAHTHTHTGAHTHTHTHAHAHTHIHAHTCTHMHPPHPPYAPTHAHPTSLKI